jgi:integration host factor subunit beta
MVKSEFIEHIANRFQQLSAEDVEMGINRLLECMSERLSKGGRIEIRGFGSFSLHYHPPRNAHNPRTGEKIITAPKHMPHFKPGKQMRDRINESRIKKIRIQERGKKHL